MRHHAMRVVQSTLLSNTIEQQTLQLSFVVRSCKEWRRPSDYMDAGFMGYQADQAQSGTTLSLIFLGLMAWQSFCWIKESTCLHT